MITGQIIAVTIMFMATVAVASLFFIPVTCFKRKTPLMNFYWSGFWVFLALLTSFAGGGCTLMLLGENSIAVSDAYVTLIMAALVVFVVLGWLHITGHFALSAVKRLFVPVRI